MTENPMQCERCGTVHAGCSAHRRDGSPCGNGPLPGQRVCRMHGGKTPGALVNAERRLEQAARERVLAEGLAAAYGDEVPLVDPAEAMLQAVSWKYFEVVALRAQVAELDEESMTWGVTREKVGGDDRGTTSEAKPNLWWSMLREAERDLVKFAAAARAAGADERRLEVEQQRVRLVALAFGKALDALTLEPGQREAATRVLLAELRAQEAGEPGGGELEA